MKKITNIKERILHYVDYKGITRENFFDGLVEITYGSFKGVSKKSALNSNAIAEIVTKYPDLNLTWLITGKGEMLNQNRISRLLLFLKEENIDRNTFAEQTTLSKPFVYHLEQFVDIDFRTIKLILAAYPYLNEEWLMFGTGNMKTKSKIKFSVRDDLVSTVDECVINYNRMPSIITVSSEDEEKENVEIVPIKLAAGYVGGGYAKEDFIRDLPRFRLPFLNNGTFRCFGVRGYSMNAIKDNDYFVGRFLDNLADFSEGKCYAIISSEAQSMLIKRVFRHPERTDMFILRSDGNDVTNTYPDIHINMRLISEMWAYEALITFSEPMYDIEKFKEILLTQPKYNIIDHEI